jgi:hypothetical protein
MSTIELKHFIIEHLSQIDDKPFLNALKTIIETKISGDTYKLSSYQEERIDSARNDLKNDKTITHNDLQKEIDQWLSTK